MPSCIRCDIDGYEIVYSIRFQCECLKFWLYDNWNNMTNDSSHKNHLEYDVQCYREYAPTVCIIMCLFGTCCICSACKGWPTKHTRTYLNKIKLEYAI